MRRYKYPTINTDTYRMNERKIERNGNGKRGGKENEEGEEGKGR